MNVEKPVFVVGTGRCGLSLVVDLIAAHETMAWFSQWSKHYPASKLALKAPYLLTRPVIKQTLRLAEKITHKNLLPKPREAYTTFDLAFRGFSLHYRPLNKNDVHNSARQGIIDMLHKQIQGQHKSRFVCELSGRARIEFLHEIFPDAKFIHVIRDPRATINSWLNVDYWLGWQGEQKWRWGPIPEKYKQYVYTDKPCFAAMGAVQYNMLVDNIIEEGSKLDNSSYMEVKFEDVIYNTQDSVKRLAAFAELEYTSVYEQNWNKVTVFDPNTRKVRIQPWKENLTDFQQTVITQACNAYLKRFNYIKDNSD